MSVHLEISCPSAGSGPSAYLESDVSVVTEPVIFGKSVVPSSWQATRRRSGRDRPARLQFVDRAEGELLLDLDGARARAAAATQDGRWRATAARERAMVMWAPGLPLPSAPRRDTPQLA